MTTSWFGLLESVPHVWETEPDQGSFGRLWRAFMSARVTIAAVLVILQASLYALGNVTSSWSIGVCLAYFGATVGVRLFARPRLASSTLDAQWLYTVGVDVIAFSGLNFLQSGAINYTPLFALPVLLSSILGPILLAFGTAASVTLLLLTHAWWLSLETMGDWPARFLQSGLSGCGFFAVALLANQLAIRLTREEQRAKASQSATRMQIRVNELVVEALTDGVLVIDIQGIVRAANPASGYLLATRNTMRTVPFVLANEAAWLPLAEIMRKTFVFGASQEADINIEYSARNVRPLHVRTRLAASQDSQHESLCVMFLEDLREMQARLRTEKMAAMGRMSAAVAHEIRNPLAAISQANALLEEDLQDAAQRQLTSMVKQNAQRLAKIVDEILNISRAQVTVAGTETAGDMLMLDEVVARIVADWSRHTASAHLLNLQTTAPQVRIVFDPEHLRRVMINLLDNALRYASQSRKAIEIKTEILPSGHARLAVWSDGRPLEKTVQSHLFEPFFSSESRSSGLGLYICRELCERYGALMAYQRTTFDVREGNEFYVLFKTTSTHDS